MKRFMVYTKNKSHPSGFVAQNYEGDEFTIKKGMLFITKPDRGGIFKIHVAVFAKGEWIRVEREEQ